MGHRGPAPPDECTVDVVDGWRAEDPAWDDRPRRPIAGVVVALAVLAAVVGSSWVTDGPGGSRVEGRAGGWRDTPSSTDPPSRFDRPIGHRVAVLTLTGLVVLDPDNGSYSEVDLGAIRSFAAAPAVAPLGPDQVAVLFADRSVGVVDLVDRSIHRIAEGAQALFTAAEPGTAWIRRQLGSGWWELTRVDAAGRPVEVSLHAPNALAPTIAAGRPVDGGAGPRAVSAPGATHTVEVHERAGSLSSYEVRIEDRSTGHQRWLRDLANPPVLTPDGRHLLVGEPITNRLTAYDVVGPGSSTLQAPDSAGVTLDWENLIVLPGRID